MTDIDISPRLPSQIRQKARGSTDAAFWEVVAKAIEDLEAWRDGAMSTIDTMQHEINQAGFALTAEAEQVAYWKADSAAAWDKCEEHRKAATARDEQIAEALQELNHCGSDGAERSIAYARDILSKGVTK